MELERSHPATSSSWTWPVWGVLAGVLGMAGHVLSIGDLTEDERRSGVDIIAALDYQAYHLGIVAGIAAAFCLIVFTAGWRRWAAVHTPGNLAADVVALSFVASAAVMILGYGMKGSLATYLPGAPEETSYPAENLLSVFMFDDFAPFIAWWGVCFAALGVAWLALRDRKLPVWVGILSAIFGVVPYAMVVVRGLPGFPGVIDPIWIVLFAVGLMIRVRKSVA